MIEIVQVLPHILDDVLNSNVNGVFNNALVQIPDDVLDHSELLEELPACVQDFMRKDILFAIDPQIGESFLSGIENFGKVAEASLLVEDFVSF